MRADGRAVSLEGLWHASKHAGNSNRFSQCCSHASWQQEPSLMERGPREALETGTAVKSLLDMYPFVNRGARKFGRAAPQALDLRRLDLATYPTPRVTQ